MLGLPGDFTPPSRFVRAVAFSQSVLPCKPATKRSCRRSTSSTISTSPKALHAGATKTRRQYRCRYTLWTSASDLKAKRFDFRSYENSQVRMVDLTKQKLDGKDIVTWSMKGDEVVKELGAPGLDLSRRIDMPSSLYSGERRRMRESRTAPAQEGPASEPAPRHATQANRHARLRLPPFVALCPHRPQCFP